MSELDSLNLLNAFKFGKPLSEIRNIRIQAQRERKTLDYNIADDNGQTILMYYILNYNFDKRILTTLIRYGTDIDRQDNKGRTPLMFAVKHHKYTALQQLIDIGADINKQKNDGWTALMYSVRFNNSVALINLIGARADINKQNYDGKTALMIAAMYNRDLNPLLEAGAEIDKQDTNGKTALMFAAKYCKIQALNTLLNYGADKTIKNINGKTAYDLGCNDAKFVLRPLNVIPYIANQTSCSICLNEFEPNNNAVVLQCGHVFHKDCVSKWAKTGKRTCPLCRMERAFFGKKRNLAKRNLAKQKRKTSSSKRKTKKRNLTRRKRNLAKRNLTRRNTIPPVRLRNQAKRLKIRLTIKQNGKRVYKTEKVLRDQIKRTIKRNKSK